MYGISGTNKHIIKNLHILSIMPKALKFQGIDGYGYSLVPVTNISVAGNSSEIS